MARTGASAARTVTASTSTSRSRRSPSAATSTACWSGSSTGASCTAPAARSTTATRRCAASGRWRDGCCFHSLMTGRFGAPANQALQRLDGRVRRRQSAARASTGEPTTARRSMPQRARVWEGAIDAFFATPHARRRSPPKAADAASTPRWSTTPADVLADPHLAARGFWRDTPTGREPGRFAVDSRGADRAHRAARSVASTPRGPLAGVRVLDFSWALVGSITTKTLGDLGADIVKIEVRTRPCLSRLDVQVSRLARRQLRRQAVVRAPQHLEAQPDAGPQAAGEPRDPATR